MRDGSLHKLWPVRRGATGRAVPAHYVCSVGARTQKTSGRTLRRGKTSPQSDGWLRIERSRDHLARSQSSNGHSRSFRRRIRRAHPLAGIIPRDEPTSVCVAAANFGHGGVKRAFQENAPSARSQAERHLQSRDPIFAWSGMSEEEAACPGTARLRTRTPRAPSSAIHRSVDRCCRLPRIG